MKLHRVFISSTIKDLLPQREAVESELLSLGFFKVVRIESFPALGRPSEQVCLEEIAQADAVFLIIDNKYGSVPRVNNPENLSVTHMEYREARRLGKQVFAFISTRSEPEPEVKKFVQEISDFNEGIFRVSWSSLADLRLEVKSSAVHLLSAELSHWPSSNSSQAGKFLLEFSTLELAADNAASWLYQFCASLEASCLKHFLPIPECSNSGDEKFKCIFENNLSQGSLRNNITLCLQDAEAEEEERITLSLVTDATTHSAEIVSDCAMGLIYAGNGQIYNGINHLLLATLSLDLSTENVEYILRIAARLSLKCDGEYSDRIVTEMMKLPKMELETIDLGVQCIIAAEIRYSLTGSDNAKYKMQQIGFEFLMTALVVSEINAEHIYTLGRQVLETAPSIGIKLYEQLLVIDPSYEERWYIHRDLGLIKYHAGHYSEAALHYDRACALKTDDSELWRWAGDALFYNGEWGEALTRYNKAISLDPIEEYFLDMKINFAESKIAKGKIADRTFCYKYSFAGRLSAVGCRIAEIGLKRISSIVFILSKYICDLNQEADKWLALYKNRQGDFDDAIKHLKNQLASIPENPFWRLNLSTNLIFKNQQIDQEAGHHLKIALFHGGQEIFYRFDVQMTNTANRQDLVNECKDILESAKQELIMWNQRRAAIREPEIFGSITHLELL